MYQDRRADRHSVARPLRYDVAPQRCADILEGCDKGSFFSVTDNRKG